MLVDGRAEGVLKGKEVGVYLSSGGKVGESRFGGEVASYCLGEGGPVYVFPVELEVLGGRGGKVEGGLDSCVVARGDEVREDHPGDDGGS